jgi:hypothetical protein
MGYIGATVNIPLGDIGLRTDEAATRLPPNSLQEANNVRFIASRIEKDGGTAKYTSTSLGGAVRAVSDWWPTPQLQRMVALTAEGKIFRDTGDGSFNSQIVVTNAETGAAPVLGTPTHDAMIVSGGNEAAGSNKKCFIFSGSGEVQVFDGDATQTSNFGAKSIGAASLTASGNTVDFTAHNFSTGNRVRFYNVATTTTITEGAVYYVINPSANDFQISTTFGGSAVNIDADGTADMYQDTRSADWISNNPKFGVGHENRLWVFGNSNRYHTVYYSDPDDHEDFISSNSGELNVFPGEADEIVAAISYKNRLFLFKRPFGVYLVDTTDPSVSNWRVYKLSDYFGAASPNSVLTALDDLLGGNSTGSITSATATDALGDVEAGDILSNGQIEQYIREILNTAGIKNQSCLYYPEKKLAMFTVSTDTASENQDSILYVDVNKKSIRFSLNTKDAASCLALRRDGNNIPRPMYGGYDGNVYLMDQANRNIDSAAFLGEFKTNESDFSFADPSLAVKNKIYDAVTIVYREQTLGDLLCDYFINGEFKETLTFPNTQGETLGVFVLDQSTLGGPRLVRRRVPLSGKGNTISFRVYNNVVDQSFEVEQIMVDFRVGDESNNT